FYFPVGSLKATAVPYGLIGILIKRTGRIGRDVVLGVFVLVACDEVGGCRQMDGPNIVVLLCRTDLQRKIVPALRQRALVPYFQAVRAPRHVGNPYIAC